MKAEERWSVFNWGSRVAAAGRECGFYDELCRMRIADARGAPFDTPGVQIRSST